MRTVLIDGDVFIYQASAAHEYETQWEPWLWTLHAEPAPAIKQFNDTIDAIVEDLKADKVVVALSDEVNWRKSVMPSYKHNRVTKRKPVIYKAMREYVAETRETYQRPGLEGDDILGILSTHPFLVKGEKIIVSIDKDMFTIPGLLLNDKRAREGMAANRGTTYADYIVTINEAGADRAHLTQTLTGDVTDGYPGCPGVGPVKAETLLNEGLILTPSERIIQRGAKKGEKEITWTPTTPGTPWQVVVSAYAAAGLSEEVALLNARVARIARSQDYDFTKREIKLWQP